ncbi:MAG: RDD family protein [Bacteroidales bacterium]
MELIESSQQEKIEYAGFWLRFAAFIIDRIILHIFSLILFIPTIFFVVTLALKIEDTSNFNSFESFMAEGNLLKVGIIVGLFLLIGLLNLAAGWLYYALMESSKYNATLGKLAIGIKVTALNGERVTFARATGRYFARIITNLTFLIGYVMAGFTERKQALHDIIASCIVIKNDISSYN